MKHEVESRFSNLMTKAAVLRRNSIAALFEQDPSRLARFVVEAAGLRLDLSKQLIDVAALDGLLAIAEVAGVTAARAAMISGETINHTEQRAVLHMALRAASGYPHGADVAAVLARMETLADDIRSGRRTGHTGRRITDVVNIGIGGSHLGPQLACDALRYASETPLGVHFLANVDGGELDRIVTGLDPATTLFIVASKSFTTAETRLNATSARAWLTRALGSEAVARHFVAVSSRPERAVEFGLAAENVFPLWDWVGGRYSLWSAIGLPIALGLGMPVFRELLAGAAAMDAHFVDAAPAHNMPVVLALVGLWNCHCLGAESYAVVPYDDRLRYLPDYLQQLEMESNGKRVGLDGAVLDHHTAPITWGGLGTNAQHAFFQLLHQGTRLVPVDFICALEHPAAPREHHDMLLANCFAQAEALMLGRSFSGGTPDARGSDLAPHRESPGNRPSSMLTMARLDPRTLGALIALYEHKTFVQSVVWGINAFDQWGVELGKELATGILDEITGAAPDAQHDASTAALIAAYRALRAGQPG